MSTASPRASKRSPKQLRGVSGAQVRLLKIDDIAALVSDVETDVVQVNRENVLDHAGVVRSVFDRTTPLPFRFGTLVTEQQLEATLQVENPLSKRKARTRARLRRDEREDHMEGFRERIRLNSPFAEQGTGTAFLAEKRREILGDERRAAEAKEIASLAASKCQ